MKILLKAAVLAEFSDGVTCLLLDLNDEAIKEILSRRHMLQGVALQDNGIYSLCFWGVPGYFYDVELEEYSEEISKNGFAVVRENFVINEEALRTDSEQVVITAHNFCFTAGIRHTSSVIESHSLDYGVLDEKPGPGDPS
jgi:hypothetical protein